MSEVMTFLAPLFALLKRRIPDRSPLGLARTYPTTILVLGTIVLCDLVTWGQDAGIYQINVLNRLGLDWDLLTQGQVWRVFTSTFVQTVPGIHFSMVVVLLTSYLLAETFAGSLPTLCVIFLSDWISSLLGMTIVRIIAAMGSSEATGLLHIPDAGSSATGHGAYALAATTLLPRKLAIGLFALLLAVTAVLFFEQHIGASIAHTISSLFGGAVGWFIVRPRLYPEEYGRE
ncbi:MAG: hypothetical protein QM589_07775 [Thermomicrobiales bacterium]